jgi:hypothetical protein
MSSTVAGESRPTSSRGLDDPSMLTASVSIRCDPLRCEWIGKHALDPIRRSERASQSVASARAIARAAGHNLRSDGESGPRGLACTEALSRLRNGAFELAVGQVQLHDGRACVKRIATDPGCEWAIELTRVERWGMDGRFLLAVVHADHDSSGAWDSVFVYACEGHRFVPAFSDKYLYGAKLELGPDSDFWLTAGSWQEGDPTCCPSSQRRTHYSWNARQKGFVIAVSLVAPLKPEH